MVLISLTRVPTNSRNVPESLLSMPSTADESVKNRTPSISMRRESLIFWYNRTATSDPMSSILGMEILTLKENQEGIRIRRSPGDFVEHLPRVLKKVFPQTLCRPVNDEQGGCASSKVRGSDGRCASSGVLQSGDPGRRPEPEAKCKAG